MPTTIVFSGGAKVEVTADAEEVRSAFAADRWCQFEGSGVSRRPIHVNSEAVAYIEGAASREAHSF